MSFYAVVSFEDNGDINKGAAVITAFGAISPDTTLDIFSSVEIAILFITETKKAETKNFGILEIEYQENTKFNAKEHKRSATTEIINSRFFGSQATGTRQRGSTLSSKITGYTILKSNVTSYRPIKAVNIAGEIETATGSKVLVKSIKANKPKHQGVCCRIC